MTDESGIHARLLAYDASQRDQTSYPEISAIRDRMKVEMPAMIRRASDSLNAIPTDGKPGLAAAVGHQLEWLSILLSIIGAAS